MGFFINGHKKIHVLSCLNDSETAPPVSGNSYLVVVVVVMTTTNKIGSEDLIDSVNFEFKINHNSKNENRKIDFSFVSAYFAYFM